MRGFGTARSAPFVGALVATVVLSGCGGGGSSDGGGGGASGSGPIKVGATATITGAFAGACTKQVAGAQAWLDSVNAKGGVNGRTIEWDVLDDAGDPQRGVSNVRKELDQDVVALFDNCGSAGTVASLPEVERAGVPNLFVNSVSDKILRPPPPTTYTLNPLYDQQLATLIPHVLQEKGPGTVALVYLDGFSDNIVPSAQWATAQAGGELVATIAVAGDTSNWGPVVIQLRDANPDYVFIAGTTPGSGQLVAAMHEQNYVPPKGVAGAYAMADEIFLQFAGDAAEGVQLVSPIVPASDPKAQACNETLPADQVPGFYTLMGCLSAQALVASLTAAGDDLSSESILKAVKSLDAADIPGLSGLSQSDSPLLTDSLYVWQVQDGKFSLQQPDPIPVPDSAQWMGQ